MTLQRRQFLTAGALVAGVAGTLPAPVLAQAQPAVTWRLTSSYPKSLDILFGTAQMFAKYVAEATDNNFQIQVFAAGEIAPGVQALDTVTSGVVQCAHTPASIYVGKEPALAFGGGLPFGLDQRWQQAWWANGGGSGIVNEGLRKFNALALPMGSAGALGGGWFRRELTGVDDLNGLKIRTSAMAGLVLARLGALPVKLNIPEIAPSLDNGTIDAATFYGPYDDDKIGLPRVAKVAHVPGCWDRAATVHLMVNLDAWAKLPKSYQAIVTQAADAANAWMLARYDALNAPVMRRLLAAGTVVKPFPAPVLEACAKAAADQYAEMAGLNPLFKKALESTTAFRADQLPWWQLSDYAMDTFTAGLQGKG